MFYLIAALLMAVHCHAAGEIHHSTQDKKKVAVCYWGLTRSTKKVYESHFSQLFNVLESNNIDYDVFIHTWKLKGKQRINSEEINIPIDYEEYKLLKPNYYKIDNQDDFTDELDLGDYFYFQVWDATGQDPYNLNGEWIPDLVLNHLCALESLKRVTNMVIETQRSYDLILYVRPDVMLNNQLDVKSMLELKEGEIMIPNFDHGEGYNDRFAILTFQTAPIYAKRIDQIADFRRNHGRIVSEKYVKFICDTYHLRVKLIDFSFDIVRP